MWKKKTFIAKPPGRIRIFARTMKLLFFLFSQKFKQLPFTKFVSICLCKTCEEENIFLYKLEF